MNFLQIIENVALEDAFQIENISSDKKFVLFANGKQTTTKHLGRISSELNWSKEGDSFTLPKGWRTFSKEGFTFFTNKENNSGPVWD